MIVQRTLPEVVADILIYHGALVEHTGEGSLEVIMPGNISQTLGISEHTKFCFSYDEIDDNHAVYASYNSDVFRTITKLFAGSGRFSNARLISPFPNNTKLTRTLTDHISFKNAIFRFVQIERKDIFYLLLYFKYTALSDDKREGILPVLINLTNMYIQTLDNGTEDIIEKLKASDSHFSIDKSEMVKIFWAAYSAARDTVKVQLKDFIKSLERRLDRDIKRVYEYYQTLKTETEKTIEKKGEGIEKLLNKLDAIETELKAKIQDITAKYTLNIKVEPVAAIRIEALVPLFWITIKRRLASRQFPVTYNPITRQFDDLPCESCFNPQGGYYVCDDHLHIVCSDCFEACSICGKQYCRACHENNCPRCEKEK
ncbi:MAG: hypothetical protein AB1638_07705 [Nitrospirota bacterium]